MRIFGRIREKARTIGTRIKRFLFEVMSSATYTVSRIVTGTVLTIGSLVGVYNLHGELKSHRLLMAGMTFIIGLPIGVILFGVEFNIFYWLTICIIGLFLMNLHSAWETIVSLRNGALDYHMMHSAIESVESVTPDMEDFKRMQAEYNMVYERVRSNSMRDKLYSSTGRLIPEPLLE